MTNADKTEYRRLSDEEVRQYSEGEFHGATVLGALAREIAERREASRTQEPAEWQVVKAARALSINHWGDEGRWEMHLDDARVALRAASITPPAPERSKEEVKYQCREIGEGGWRDCTKEEYDRLALDPQHDTRTIEPASLWREFRPEEDLPPTGMVEVRWRDSAPGKEPHKGDAAAIGWQYVAWWRPVASPAPLPVTVTDAARDVLAERKRQVEAEGWTPEHDDQHRGGSLATAAACYAAHDQMGMEMRSFGNRDLGRVPELWPRSWDYTWFKPTDRRRDLVKAGALVLAEIERLDRAVLSRPGEQG